jgi:hypothetical protein
MSRSELERLVAEAEGRSDLRQRLQGCHSREELAPRPLQQKGLPTREPCADSGGVWGESLDSAPDLVVTRAGGFVRRNRLLLAQA